MYILNISIIILDSKLNSVNVSMYVLSAALNKLQANEDPCPFVRRQYIPTIWLET